MKLERIQEYVLPAVATLCGMGFAVYVGSLMGQGQVSRVAMLLGGLFLCFLTMVLRQHIWILIVVAWPWLGSSPALPVSFAVRDVAVMAVFASFLALKALKVSRRKPNWGLPDIVMVVMLVYLLTVFVRNPVGFLATNSERVGGRPYFNVGIACLAYFVLARASLPIVGAARFLLLGILGSNYAIAALDIVADLSPRAGRAILGFYTGLSVIPDPGSAPPVLAPGETVERLSYLGSIGSPSVLALTSFFRPLTLINPLYFVRFLMLLASVGCILLTGFRNALVAAGAYFIISSYLRAGWMEIVRLGVIGFAGLGILLLGQGRLFNLPLSAQRTLSFLPGDWSYAAKESAATSTEWRLEMWRIFLKGSKYVQNKWLGDGFGVTKRDLAALSLADQRGGGNQETMLVLGSVHNGPLSTIRFVGYVGLLLYLVLMSLVARMAWQVARRADGTPFRPLAYFVCLPLIYEPFNFIAVFGAFDASFPTMIYGLGMLKMVDNTVTDYLGRAPQTAPLSHRRIAEPEFALAGGAR